MHRARASLKFPKYFAPIFAATLPTLFNHKNPAVNDSENKQQPIENNHKKPSKMNWPNIDDLLTLPDPTQETGTWNDNWDHREPIEMAKDNRKYLNGSEEERKQILADLTPKATRNIFLIRHGQYMTDAEHRDEQKLTPLGREQSAFLGKRFTAAKDRFKLDKCTFSTMIRARETGQIMKSEMTHFQLECQLDPILEEGLPCLVDPPTLPLWTRKRKAYHKHAPRIEAAFRKYFHRASPKQANDSFELIVCHANVIRYFVCRALQSPPERWLRYSLAHASITWIQILPNGHVKIMAMGDFGHIPPEKMSFF